VASSAAAGAPEIPPAVAGETLDMDAILRIV
jgi:hypothetical protein